MSDDEGIVPFDLPIVDSKFDPSVSAWSAMETPASANIPIFPTIVFRPDEFDEFPVPARPQVSQPGYGELQDAFASVFAEHYADPTEVRVCQPDRVVLERVLIGMPWASIVGVGWTPSMSIINLTTGGQVQIVLDPQVPQGTAVIAGDRRRKRWLL